MEEHKFSWMKFLGVILATFIGAFLAFYLVMHIMVNRMMSPEYQMKRMEKMVQQEQRNFQRAEEKYGENPFEPRMAPMLVNLVKESDEYKVIVDLKPIGGDEKNVNVKLDNNIITVSGEVERNEHHRESIMHFSQSYYLDEKLKSDKISKERKGNKYIITIPYED